MKTFFKTSLILLVTLTGIIACGDDSEGNPPETKAVLHLDKESLAFGEIAQENPKDLEFVISNKGDGILKITSAEIEGTNKDQFSISLTTQDIEAGKKATFTVTFQPNMGGDKVAELKLVTNVGTKTINITGNAQYSDDNIIDFDPELKRYYMDYGGLDLNADDNFQYSEIKDVEDLILSQSYNVKSLKYVEILTKLVTLEIDGDANFTTIDVSKNINLNRLALKRCFSLKKIVLGSNVNLKSLDIQRADVLETIDISGCTKLEDLYINESIINTLNCSKNTELKKIGLVKTNITGLDLSSNTKLEQLSFKGTNGLLTSLNLKNITTLNQYKVNIMEQANLDCVSVDAGVDITNWNFYNSGTATSGGTVGKCN